MMWHWSGVSHFSHKQGHHPRKATSWLDGCSKSDLITLSLFFDVAPLMSYGKKTSFSTCFAIYTQFFLPPSCTWSAVIGWISAKMTSSGNFAYLSAGRSWLATFIRDQTTEKVSISPSLTRLAGRPCPMLGVLALWVVHPRHHPRGCPPRPLVPQNSVRCPINMLTFGRRPVLARPRPDSFA